MLTDLRIFIKQFWQQYHTTGAILPSGRRLCKALAKFVAEPGEGGRRILEVGPATGVVTQRIIEAMRPEDTLDLVELNDAFVERLHERIAEDPKWQHAADRIRVHHCPIQDFEAEEPFDLIVSGLPLNNFEVELVDSLLSTMTGLLAEGGTLSFFEYIAIRKMKAVVSGRKTRERLRGIGQVMGDLFERGEFRRDKVLLNVTPAWVHHIRFDTPNGKGEE